MAAVILCSCFTLGTVFMSATSSTRLSCVASWAQECCACVASWTNWLSLVLNPHMMHQQHLQIRSLAAKPPLMCLADSHKHPS